MTRTHQPRPEDVHILVLKTCEPSITAIPYEREAEAGMIQKSGRKPRNAGGLSQQEKAGNGLSPELPEL